MSRCGPVPRGCRGGSCAAASSSPQPEAGSQHLTKGLCLGAALCAWMPEETSWLGPTALCADSRLLREPLGKQAAVVPLPCAYFLGSPERSAFGVLVPQRQAGTQTGIVP